MANFRMQANFRHKYIQQCVGDEREANQPELAKILGDQTDIDIMRVRMFSWMYKMPTAYRRQLWKILLGVTVESRQVRDAVEKHRLQEGELLYNGLRTMRLADVDAPAARLRLAQAGIRKSRVCSGDTATNESSRVGSDNSDSESSDRTTLRGDDDGALTPTPSEPNTLTQQMGEEELERAMRENARRSRTARHKTAYVSKQGIHITPNDIAKMILLSESRISEKGSLKRENGYLLGIAEHMLHVCGADHWQDAFHLTRGMQRLMAKTYEDEDELCKHIHTIRLLLESNVGPHSRLHKPDVFNSFPIEQWLKGGGAPLIRSHRALHRFWDKVCTGEATTILMNTLVVDYLTTIDSTFGDELEEKPNYQLSDDGESRMVRRVLVQVHKMGGRMCKSSGDLKNKYETYTKKMQQAQQSIL